MTRLRIQLFGPLTVWRDERPISKADWSSPKARQLFKILATFRERIVAGDELVEWLWPGLAPDSARNSLWVAVSQLRRFLEPGVTGRGRSAFILSHSPGYRFSSQDCDIDVDAFLACVADGRAHARAGDIGAAIDAYRAAERLYADDLLTDDPYEDWAIAAREHLRETNAAGEESWRGRVEHIPSGEVRYVEDIAAVIRLMERWMTLDEDKARSME